MRTLKSSGKEKSVWQPEVTILLELKKQLEQASVAVATNNVSSSEPKPAQNGCSSTGDADVKHLQEAVDKQVGITKYIRAG